MICEGALSNHRYFGMTRGKPVFVKSAKKESIPFSLPRDLSSVAIAGYGAIDSTLGIDGNPIGAQH